MGNSNTNLIDGHSNNCVFCRIILTNVETLLYEDELFVIFADIKPQAYVHLQAVPKLHIKNINYLSHENLSLIQHMKQKTKEYFKQNYDNFTELEMGFHIPPFYSITHLHMHCLLPPVKSSISTFINFKMFFRTVDDQIKKLGG